MRSEANVILQIIYSLIPNKQLDDANKQRSRNSTRHGERPPEDGRTGVTKTRRGFNDDEHIKEIMGVKEKPDILDIIERKRLQWYGHVKRMQDERLPKLIMEWIPGERRKTWMESVRAAMKTKKFRSRSVVKQKGMVFGFRKTVTAVTRPER
jgi:hypothetical protein